MALETVRSLVAAQARSTWNRSLSEAGMAGASASVAVFMVVVGVLVVPAVFTLIAGHRFGSDLVNGGHDALFHWNALLALFSTGLAFLGGFRHRLAFTRRDLGWYPITCLDMLFAEIPAGLFEALPLLGFSGIVCANLGLAVVAPAATPMILVLTIQGIVWMLVLQHLVGTAKRFLLKRPMWLSILIGLVFLTGARIFMNGIDIRPHIREVGRFVIEWLPGSIGYGGMKEIMAGRIGQGLPLLAVAVVATALLVVVTAWLNARELESEQAPPRRRKRSMTLAFVRPAGGVARLFEKQLLQSQTGWMLLGMPVLVGGTVTLVVWVRRTIEARGDELPEVIAGVTGRILQVPLVEVLMFLVIWLSAEICLNQFGWDRHGLRTLLVLPLTMNQILLGKLIAIVRFTVLQVLVGVVPLLIVYHPSLHELIRGTTAAGASLIVFACFGHAFSARFPRAISQGGISPMPIYLAWVPGAVMVMLGSLTVVITRLAAMIAPWAPDVVLSLLFVGSIIGYRALLPTVSRYVVHQQERLLTVSH